MNDPRPDNAAATFDFSIDDNSSILGGSVGDDSFLNSLESGGALLSMAGHWSTADGSMQWTGGKEELFDPWSTAGPGAAADTRGCTPASAGASEPIKPDPSGAWLSSALIGDLETKTSSTVTNSQSLPAPAASAEAPNNDGGSLRPFPNRYARDGVSVKDEVIDTKGQQQQQQQQQCQQPPGHQLPPTTAPAPTTTAEAVAALPNRTTRRQSSLIARGRTPAAPVAAATSAGARFPGGAGVSTVEAPTAPPPTGEGADDDDDDDDEGDEMGEGSAGMDSELSEKRRRNREHAKRSRMRKRVRLGGLEDMVLELRRENIRLRQIVKQGIPDLAEDILRKCAKDNINADLVDKEDVVQGMRPAMTIAGSSSHSGGGGSAGSRARPKLEGGSSSSSGSGSGRRHKDRRVPSALKLMSPSYQSVRALSESQANFILTNPNLPGCPIIYASPGFLELTGYEASQVMGKNCRFLQGPGTDPVAVSIIRNNLKYGRDTSVCILNYKADGKPFWNQLSIGNLLDAHGKVANHVGVLCEVKQMPPADFRRLLHRVPLPESLLHDSSDSGEDAGRYNDNNSNNASSVSRSNQGAPTPRSTTNVDDSNRSGGNDNKRRAGLPRVVDRLRRTRAAAASSSEQ